MLVENSWIQKGDVQARVTVSVGATMAVPDEAADEVVDRADRRLCASRSAGRNRVTTDGVLPVRAAEPPLLGTGVPKGLRRGVGGRPDRVPSGQPRPSRMRTSATIVIDPVTSTPAPYCSAASAS